MQKCTRRIRNLAIAAAALAVLLLPNQLSRAQQSAAVVPNMAAFPDGSGIVRTFSQNGNLDLSGPFFQALGANGRSCGTCHQPSDGMTVSAAHIQRRFRQSLGMDPIFRTVDGSNCDHDIDVSTLDGRRAAFSLLRTRGLIRVAMPPPENRDFEITSVINPYGCSETGVISMYRRPLPAANLRFLTAVMWDGRESSAETGTSAVNSAQTLADDLAHQAFDATMGHAQSGPPGPTAELQKAIVSFEMGLSTAQAEDHMAGSLTAEGSTGGPEALSRQTFTLGINDPVGLDPANPVPFQFQTKVFSLFDSWQNLADPQRQAILRGQTVFNTKTFTISGVPGLNGATFSNGVKGPDSIVSTCGLCHDAPNVGNHSVAVALNIGVADPPGGLNPFDTSYLPVITICQRPGLTNCVQITDPGRAMVTGKFADVGKFKGPVLRGLAARAPYFHNGGAATLLDVVGFYDTRFHIGLTAQEKSDLAAFLGAL